VLVEGITITAQSVDDTLKTVPPGTVTSNIGVTGGPFNPGVSINRTVPTFKIGETEITYELWYAVRTWAEFNGYTFGSPGREGHNGTDGAVPTSDDQEPVTNVTWRDAVVWCNAYSEAVGRTPVYYLNGTTGAGFDDPTKVLRVSEGSGVSPGDGEADRMTSYSSADGFRLPTEEQWEYAARGGDPTDTTNWNYTYAGSSSIGGVAWYSSNSSSSTYAVKGKTPNSRGLYDMSGNVMEWCESLYHVSYTSRMFRGGYWGDSASSCRVDFRDYGYPNYRGNDMGFRVVCP
jgi:formylglycine-generating enzyme required for sulfatase activity